MEIDMTSDDVDRQIELLKYYPEVVVKYYKPALINATSILEGVIKPLIPEGNTGKLAAFFGSKVTGRQINTLKGVVGWPTGAPWYAHLAEGGAKEHEIKPRGNKISKKRARQGGGPTTTLRWPGGSDGGDWIYRRTVNHPGAKAAGFMAAGWAAAQPIVETFLSAASEQVVNEMAVP
jgi:hypothetical protein